MKKEILLNSEKLRVANRNTKIFSKCGVISLILPPFLSTLADSSNKLFTSSSFMCSKKASENM